MKMSISLKYLIKHMWQLNGTNPERNFLQS